jgi:hypothetical protein
VAALVGSDQRSRAAALAAPGQPDALLHHAAAEVGIDQPGSHLLDGLAQGGIGHFRLAHLSLEVAGFEDSRHRLDYAT